MHLKIYLAGDLERINPWRERVIKHLQGFNVTWLSPIDNIDYKFNAELPLPNRNIFIDSDLKKIEQSDIIFAYFRLCGSRHSGTSAEVGYAKKAGKLIILVNDMPDKEEYLYSFVRGLVPERRYFRSLNEGIDYLENFLIEMNYNPLVKGEV